MRQWEKEFGADVKVPREIDRLVEQGALTDESWHNDAGPRFEQPEPKGFGIWVDWPDKERSDWPDGFPGSDGWHRYLVYEMPPDNREAGEDRYYGDDLEEALRVMGFDPADYRPKVEVVMMVDGERYWSQIEVEVSDRNLDFLAGALAAQCEDVDKFGDIDAEDSRAAEEQG